MLETACPHAVESTNEKKRLHSQLFRASSSILLHSSALSWSFSAAMFSSRCASDDVPGIGNMTGDLCSNHASASCTTLTLRRFASASNGLLALLNERLPLPPIGAHGMNPIFSFSQYLSASSESRSVMLYRFWILTIGMTFFARSISATVTSDNPTCGFFRHPAR